MDDESNTASQRVEYRLGLWQVFLNPLGALIFRGFSIAFFGYCLYLNLATGKTNVAAWVFALALLIAAGSGLFYGYGRVRASTIWIEFRNGRLSTNYAGDPGIFGDTGIPFSMLKVRSGIAGVLIFEAVSGHTIIVPRHIVPLDVLRQVGGLPA